MIEIISTGNIDDLPLANTGDLLSEVGEYTVWQTQKYRWLQDGDAIQSIMDRALPSKLILPTHHAMFCALAALPQAKNVLNLGCGPGAIERKLTSSFPHLSCTSVDASQAILDLAKEYFLLPPNHQFIKVSAEAFLASNSKKFDIVMVDLFQGEAMAQCLYDALFHHRIASCLKPNGIVALNLIPKDQNDLLEVLVMLRKNTPKVMLSEIDNRSNIVLLAARDNDFDVSQLSRRRKKNEDSFEVDLLTASKRFLRLPDTQIHNVCD